ncbi:hypothetical protein [Solicola gregarius]|uniref:Uncharacterized protein n=1 Tax=Solicola gregarius TaxID=2908642 RepID=A0AA46TLG9_9ACTN|nr:hypothetical protein [Solicola gregarius]UYM07435.1 hypothetical protein L0C25_10310 [Solicola gregarius]
MTEGNRGGWSGTATEPIYEQLLREADEGIRRSVLAGQSSRVGAPHPPPAPPADWTRTPYPG